MLGISDRATRERITAFQEQQAESVRARDAALQDRSKE
jgi:hypothetical protein